MNTNHNRIKVADLEQNEPDKILKTNDKGELEFIDSSQIQYENYNALDCTTEGKTLDARQGKFLGDTKENMSNKSLTLSSQSTHDDYPSSKTVFDFVNAVVKSENKLNATEIVDLVASKSLVPGNYYLINDFQTIYKINGSDSAPAVYSREITSFVSKYAILNSGVDANLAVGKSVVITKLPDGYNGVLVIGSSTTVSVNSQNYYLKFANGMQDVLGLQFEYTMPRYSNGNADNLTVNDANGKPVIRPGGVLNIDVHNSTPYMNMSAAENLSVPLESIMLRAKSTNEFELEGKSVTYIDDIIEYRLPVAGSLATKGTILRRYNNALNIDLKIDWRVQRYRRWKISDSSILKILNQDQPVTSLTGFKGVYQFTAKLSSTATTDRFYIASDLDSPSQTIDVDTKVVEFTMDVLSYTDTKDFTIFKLDKNHNPANVSKMKVSGFFGNTIIQNNTGEFNVGTNVNVEQLYNTTFVCSVNIYGDFVKINNSLFLDTVEFRPATKALLLINQTKVLSYLIISFATSSVLTSCVIGINTNNYDAAPGGGNPSTRWVMINRLENSTLTNVVLGGSLSTYEFTNAIIIDCTLFFYYTYSNQTNSSIYYKGRLIFNNTNMLFMSIFHRAKTSNIIFSDIMSNVDYKPSSLSGRDVYVIPTYLGDIKVKMNKYNRKLYYEDRDASDVLTINTYATPQP